jgi:fatty-acyl-CoA synthase
VKEDMADTMQSTMMEFPASVQMIMRHGTRHHMHSEVLTFDGSRLDRTSFGEVADNAAKLASLLIDLGVKAGDRVATFCWNHRAHMEAYLAVPSMGAILHTLNIRLHPEQIAFIANHAQDRVLIADSTLLHLLLDVLPHTPAIEHLIVVGPIPDNFTFHRGISCYDEEIVTRAPYTAWPDLDEKLAAAVCYTSGTTGNPKGVVYSHRSIFMHTLCSLGADTFGISQRDRILLMPPMFHANAWGLPFSAWLSGAQLIMPGPHLQPRHIRSIVECSRPTFTAMVPTLINDLIREHQARPVDMSSFRLLVGGGSAVSPAIIEAVHDCWRLPLMQGWGMTETSPLCALAVPPVDATPEESRLYYAKTGRAVPGVEIRIADENVEPLANDGATVGELQLRGPWISGGYHRVPTGDNLTQDGWLRTGDVGSIDQHGYVQITDRVKDVIKSGGEWISSVELENLLAAHEDIIDVAVIGVADPRWEERPLAVAVLREGSHVGPTELRAYLAPHLARFCVPEYWAFQTELPRTSVGKIDKRKIREKVGSGTIRYIVEAGLSLAACKPK